MHAVGMNALLIHFEVTHSILPVCSFCGAVGQLATHCPCVPPSEQKSADPSSVDEQPRVITGRMDDEADRDAE